LLNLPGAKRMSKQYLAAAISASLLTACGGGGGDANETAPAAPILTGTFVDSPVEGLKYDTPTQSGLTNELGEFSYLEGESVTFYLGGTQLGVTQGADQVTPFSLYGINALTTEFEISEALIGDTVNSFDRALNTATLLQTFDIDGNPENGINLGSNDENLKSVSIPLLVKASTFENQTALADAKILAGISQTRSFGDATKHLYDSLNIEIKSSLTARFTSSQNDKQLSSVSFEYNSDGQVTSENTDSNNDGEIDINKTFTYDNNGNLSQVTNSASNTVESLSYDTDNNLLSRFIDSQQGSDTEESYTYQDTKLQRFDLDQNADGSIEISTHYTYSPQGNLSSIEVDRNGDDVADSVSSYFYQNSQLTSYAADDNNDGTPNIIITYAYDEKGNRTSQNIDLSAEGAPNSIGTFEYDAQNNPVRYEQDRNLDGFADYIEAYAHDKNNLRTLYKRDLNADGIWDIVAQYFYDINGNRVKMIEDSNGNGIADKVWTGDYQAAILDDTWDIILGKL